MDFNNLKKKIQRHLPNVCDLHKQNHTLGYGFKIQQIFVLCDFHLRQATGTTNSQFRSESESSQFESILTMRASRPSCLF
jgi:hypothetical protein